MESTVTLFFVAVITPSASCDTVSMNDNVFPAAVGEDLAVCFRLNSPCMSEYVFPESLMFPALSNTAMWFSVAVYTLSTLSSKAAWVAVEIGLSMSAVLSTLPRPTWAAVTECGLPVSARWSS